MNEAPRDVANVHSEPRTDGRPDYRSDKTKLNRFWRFVGQLPPPTRRTKEKKFGVYRQVCAIKTNDKKKQTKRNANDGHGSAGDRTRVC